MSVLCVTVPGASTDFPMAFILLVDDQSSMRLTLTALLKSAGHTLAQSGTGADALDKISKRLRCRHHRPQTRYHFRHGRSQSR
jgi:hypothetical protein